MLRLLILKKPLKKTNLSIFAQIIILIPTVLDYDSCLPVFIRITDGNTSDIEIAERLSFPKGSIMTIDRGYLDLNFFHDLDSTD